MALTWLEALVTQRAASRQSSSGPLPLRDVAAHLLAGRFSSLDEDQLRELARTGPPEPHDPEHVLVRAIIGLLEERAQEVVKPLEDMAHRSDKPDIRLAATVLLLVAADRVDDDAISHAELLLEQCRDQITRVWTAEANEGKHVAAQSLIDLHRGMRRARAGSWTEARDLADRAVEQSAGRRDEVNRTLYAVARDNAENYAFRADPGGSTARPRHRRTSAPWPIHLRVQDIAGGLRAYVDEQASETFAAPQSRSHTWHIRDPVAMRLEPVMLRDACRASFADARSSARLAAITELLRGPTEPEESRASALRRLVASGDHQTTSSVVGWLWREGPLHELSYVTEALAVGRWSPAEEHAIISLVGGAGDLLDEAAADTTVQRLIELVLHEQPREFRPEFKALPALRRPLAAASDAAHRQAAASLIAIWDRNSMTDLSAHGLAQTVYAIDWSHVEESVLTRWQQLAEHEQQTRSSKKVGFRESLTAALVLRLGQHEPSWASDIARRMWSEHHSALRAAVLMDAPGDTGSDELAHIVAWATEEVETEVRQARSVRGLGVPPVVVLVAALLLRGTEASEDMNGWTAIGRYLAAPESDLDTTAEVADRIVDAADSLTSTAIDALTRGLGPDLAVQGTSSDEREATTPVGARLRLRLALERYTLTDALIEFSKLAGSGDAADRLEAAWTLPVLVANEHTGAEMFALSLSHDSAADVRSACGTVLVELAQLLSEDHPLVSAPAERLQALLQDPGALPPLLALHGLASGDGSTTGLRSSLRDSVDWLGAHHPSALVRQAAAPLVRDETPR